MKSHFQEHADYTAAVKREIKEMHRNWLDCQRCKLGERRIVNGGSYIRGVGTPHGILFVAGGPTWKEEKEGVPLAEDSGNLIHIALIVAVIIVIYNVAFARRRTY